MRDPSLNNYVLVMLLIFSGDKLIMSCDISTFRLIGCSTSFLTGHNNPVSGNAIVNLLAKLTALKRFG